SHHPEDFVVNNRELDRPVVFGYSRQLLEGHHEAAVTTDRPDGVVGGGDLSAHCRRHLEAHRAEPAGGDEAVRPVVPEVLGSPHLVLADAGDDVAVALRRLVYLLDDVLRQHFLRLADDDRRVLAAHLIEPGEPALARLVGDVLVQLAKGRSSVAAQRRVWLDVLADLRRVDFEVDDLGLRREVLQAACHSVVEAHTHADEEVRLADRDVVPVHPVHPGDRKSTRLNSSHVAISYAVFCLKKKKKNSERTQPEPTCTTRIDKTS